MVPVGDGGFFLVTFFAGFLTAFLTAFFTAFLAGVLTAFLAGVLTAFLAAFFTAFFTAFLTAFLVAIGDSPYVHDFPQGVLPSHIKPIAVPIVITNAARVNFSTPLSDIAGSQQGKRFAEIRIIAQRGHYFA